MSDQEPPSNEPDPDAEVDVDEEHLAGDDVRTGFVVLSSGDVTPVQYAVVDGLAIFEGDIVLGTVEEMERRSAVLSSRAQQGDEDVAHGVAITGQGFRWPNATIPYQVSASLPNAGRVTAAVAHWEANTNMRLVQRTGANASSYPNYVEVIPASGCWSQVGMQGGRQELGLAGGCGTGSTIHEFGHAFGLWHEQSREDRDSYVTIHWENIESGKSHNFNQHIADGDDIGGYDYDSIMHYGRTAFSKNLQDTITPKQAGASIGQRSGLSAGDIAAVHHIYRTWHHGIGVSQTYATPASENAWGHLSGLGWRKVNPDAPAGVTNVFAMLVWARAKDRPVTVELDGSTIYAAYLS